jgi:hypothetical protein
MRGIGSSPVAEFIDQLRHRVVVPTRQPYSLACRYNNPMPELTLSPSQGSMNSATEGEHWVHDSSSDLDLKNTSPLTTKPPASLLHSNFQLFLVHIIHAIIMKYVSSCLYHAPKNNKSKRKAQIGWGRGVSRVRKISIREGDNSSYS